MRATVFLPATAPRVKVARLRGYGAAVRLVGSEYADAVAACEEFASASGALASHAYDNPLIAAGAGTLLDEIRDQVPGLDTVVVAVGGGGLFAGIATAALHHGLSTVAVEPENSRALNAALDADKVVDVPVDSVAADSLGARRTCRLAFHAAKQRGAKSVLVPDSEIVRARKALWEQYRLVVEHGAATSLAALLAPPQLVTQRLVAQSRVVRRGPAYKPRSGERVVVVLCGANTDPSDLIYDPTET